MVPPPQNSIHQKDFSFFFFFKKKNKLLLLGWEEESSTCRPLLFILYFVNRIYLYFISYHGRKCKRFCYPSKCSHCGGRTRRRTGCAIFCADFVGFAIRAKIRYFSFFFARGNKTNLHLPFHHPALCLNFTFQILTQHK